MRGPGCGSGEPLKLLVWGKKGQDLQVARKYLFHCGLLHGLQGNVCLSTWSTSTPSFYPLGVCRAVSLTFSFTHHPQAVFCLSLNMSWQRCHHLGWGVQLCPVLGPLEPTGTGCVQHGTAPGLLSERPPLQPPLLPKPNLATYTQYKSIPKTWLRQGLGVQGWAETGLLILWMRGGSRAGWSGSVRLCVVLRALAFPRMVPRTIFVCIWPCLCRGCIVFWWDMCSEGSSLCNISHSPRRGFFGGCI